ncbi:MAG: glycosyltransferase family 2 protein [Myxococcota bacterium]
MSTAQGSSLPGTLDLAVILLNYRRADLVLDCLASLEPECRGAPGICVIVVDNASGDGSAARIAEAIGARGWGGWARLVESPVNGGFSAGNNVGIAAVAAEHYLLLNSDTLVRPGALAALLATMRAQPEVGLLGPRLEGPDGVAQESCFRFHSPWSELMAAAATGPISRLLRRHAVALPAADAPHEAEWISFACVLIRAAALREIGLLDDAYFMYFEDMDYCRRAREKGWRIRYEPAAHVVHLRGGSSPVKQAFAERRRVPTYYFASRTRYFAKYYGGTLGVVLANSAWLAGRCVSLARELVGNKRPHTAERHAFDIWTRWLRPLAPPERPAS